MPGDVVALLHSRSATAGLLNAEERFDAPKCDQGTRISMIRGMTNFVRDGGPFSSPGIYWIHGPAGVGKSALSQSLVLSLKAEGEHAASFFFSRTAPGRNNGNQLIVTLAYQIAIAFPALQPLLSNTIKKNPDVLTASNHVKMQSTQSIPGTKVTNGAYGDGPTKSSMDGLDECNDPQVQRDLILCIRRAVHQLSLPFKFVIASRPESHIVATFELDPVFQGPQGVEVLTKNLGDDEGADAQITTFLLTEFAEIRRTHPIRDFLPQHWPLPDQITQLVAKSSKGFIYPATVIRYIKMPKNRPDECLERIFGLSEIPISDKPYEPLDALYRCIFESLPDDSKAAVHDIFCFLVVPSKVEQFVLINADVIEECLGYKPAHVQQLLRDLLCLVSLAAQDQPIKILHASLPDFLLDQSRSGNLCIDPADAHAAFVATFPVALRILCFNPLPSFDFVGFLEHMCLANMSNPIAQRQLLAIQWESRLRLFLDLCGHKPDRFGSSVECVKFFISYFLVLASKNTEHTELRQQISVMRLSILNETPLLSSTSDGLLDDMKNIFRNWAISVRTDNALSNTIFAQHDLIRPHEVWAEILDLYFILMLLLLWLETGGDCGDNSQIPANWACYTFLTILLRRNDHNATTLTISVTSLGLELLKPALKQAAYSASLIAILRKVIDAAIPDSPFDWEIQAQQSAWARQHHVPPPPIQVVLAANVIEYLKARRMFRKMCLLQCLLNPLKNLARTNGSPSSGPAGDT